MLFFFKGLGKLQKIAPVRTCKPCLPILYSFRLGSFIHTSSLRLSMPNKPFTLKCSTHIQVDAIESPKCLLSKISLISLYFMGLLSPQSLESYPWCHLWFVFVKHAHKWDKALCPVPQRCIVLLSVQCFVQSYRNYELHILMTVNIAFIIHLTS